MASPHALLLSCTLILVFSFRHCDFAMTSSINIAVFLDMDVESNCNHRYTYKVQTVNGSLIKSVLSDGFEVLMPQYTVDFKGRSLGFFNESVSF